MGKTYDRFEFVRFDPSNCETAKRQFTNILTKSNVPKNSIKYIFQSFCGRERMIHSTFNNSNRNAYSKQLKNDPSLLKKLIKIFYYDYVLFGFPFPRFD